MVQIGGKRIKELQDGLRSAVLSWHSAASESERAEFDAWVLYFKEVPGMPDFMARVLAFTAVETKGVC